MAEPAKAETKTAVIVNASPPRPKTLAIGSVQLAEHKRNQWVGETDSATTIAEMLAPEFWIHDARKFRARDEVEVWANDGSWLEVFVVRSVSIPEMGKPVVRVVRRDDIPRADDKKPEPVAVGGLGVKWRGPHSKWAVVRDSDKEVLKDKFDTSEDAVAWRDQFSQAA